MAQDSVELVSYFLKCKLSVSSDHCIMMGIEADLMLLRILGLSNHQTMSFDYAILCNESYNVSFLIEHGFFCMDIDEGSTLESPPRDLVKIMLKPNVPN